MVRVAMLRLGVDRMSSQGLLEMLQIVTRFLTYESPSQYIADLSDPAARDDMIARVEDALAEGAS